jgi:hypothetical protein
LKKPLFFFVFCFVSGSVGLHQADSGQQPMAFQLPTPTPVPIANLAGKPSATKLIRIYNGAGYFDDALAEKLRPTLAKAFPFSEPPKAVTEATPVTPVKPESQNRVAAAAHL